MGMGQAEEAKGCGCKALLTTRYSDIRCLALFVTVNVVSLHREHLRRLEGIVHSVCADGKYGMEPSSQGGECGEGLMVSSHCCASAVKGVLSVSPLMSDMDIDDDEVCRVVDTQRLHSEVTCANGELGCQ